MGSLIAFFLLLVALFSAPLIIVSKLYVDTKLALEKEQEKSQKYINLYHNLRDKSIDITI